MRQANKPDTLRREGDTVADAFLRLLELEGETVRSAAERLGFDRSKVHRLYSGSQKLTVEELEHIAAVYGIDPAAFF